MASVQKRPPRTPGSPVTFRVRFRDPAGVQRSKTFGTVTAAKQFAATVETDKARGNYVDQRLGKITLRDYAEQWLAVQTFGESTREQTTHRLRRHVLPPLGDTPLAALRTSQVQAWVRTKQQELGPRTVRLLVSLLSAVMNAAVDDERIPRNPVKASSIRLPKLEDRRFVPWTDTEVAALWGALPDRYALALVVAAGLGLRQSEVFGLAVEDVDFLRGVVRVQRQVAILQNRLVFALPKNRKVREVPLSSSVATQLSRHLQTFPARSVTLPWESRAGKPVTARLFLTSREGGAINRNYFNRSVWKPALAAANLPTGRDQMMHAGRHLFASVQLEAGTSVRALAEYLGHADVGFTLRTYTHLMPQAEDKAKRAVDGFLQRLEGAFADPLCGPDVAQDPL